MERSNITRRLASLLIIIALCACGAQREKPVSTAAIDDEVQQAAIFRSLIQLTNNAIPESVRTDSLAFLILPVQASCPSCRTKTIDSIVKHERSLAGGRFIVISATGGRKTIASFFREQNKELPVIENRLFLDSTNQASEYGLLDDKPTIYYTGNGKAYKKVGSIPATVKKDLHQFFSGK